MATTSNEPVVTALQVWSGDPVQGGSGYLVLYGTDLTTYWGATTVASSSGVSTSVTYESPTQINLSFMIDGGATVGTDTVSVSDLFGISSQPFTIYSSGSGWVAEDGLSGVVTSSVEDPDGTWEFSMSQDDFTTLYANTQEYFQSCGCQDISNVLQTWGNSIAQSNTRLIVSYLQDVVSVLRWVGVFNQTRTPVQGQPPNSVSHIQSLVARQFGSLVPTDAQ